MNEEQVVGDQLLWIVVIILIILFFYGIIKVTDYLDPPNDDEWKRESSR